MKKLIVIVACGLLCVTGCKSPRQVFSVNQSNPYFNPAPQTYVVAGQSNAVNILYWDQSRQTLISEIAKRTGSSQITLIQCAVNGTSISQWQPGMPIYKACIDSMKAAKSPVLGLFWWQGEADSGYVNPPAIDPNQWAFLFTTTINSLRKDTNLPHLRIAFARIGDFLALEPEVDIVRRQQESVRISNSVMVNLDGIAPRLNDVHYDADGYSAAAKRFVGEFFSGD